MFSVIDESMKLIFLIANILYIYQNNKREEPESERKSSEKVLVKMDDRHLSDSIKESSYLDNKSNA